MENKPVVYAKLKQVLHQLGFEETVVPGSYVVFNHPAPNTLLIYREYRPEEIVSWADMVSTRRFLDLRGLVEAEVFDRLLHEQAA